MDDTFRIYVEQLKEGEPKQIAEETSPQFLITEDKEIEFKKSVVFEGQYYIVEDELIIRLLVETEANLPCAVCNDWVPVEIKLDDIVFAIPLENIKGGIYNFQEPLREEILLNVPQFAECNEGQCPQRKEIEKYLKKKSLSEDEDTYRPFENL